MSKTAISVSATSTQRQPLRRAPSIPRRRMYVTTCVASLLLLCLAGFLYFQFTLVTGIEINTGTWELRQFSFRRDPLTNRQFTGVRHKAPLHRQLWTPLATTATLDSSLATHLQPSDHAPPRWDLVQIQTAMNPGDAGVLMDLISATDDAYRPFWTSWSKNHPRQAAILWPAAQDLARARAYAYLPPLFELALTQLSTQEFEGLLNRYLHETLLEHARYLTASNQQAHALTAAKIGLEYGDLQALQDIVDELMDDEPPPP